MAIKTSDKFGANFSLDINVKTYTMSMYFFTLYFAESDHEINRYGSIA